MIVFAIGSDDCSAHQQQASLSWQMLVFAIGADDCLAYQQQASLSFICLHCEELAK